MQWIAAILGMNETLAGVTIVALGNAGPDQSSKDYVFSNFLEFSKSF